MLPIAHVLLALTLFGVLVFGGALQADQPLGLEVFTTATLSIGGKDDHRLQGANVSIHVVDGLEQFESSISQDLPANANAAKAESLRRIGDLNEARIGLAKDAAIGLAKAVQFGIDRYPAIVFNGTSVVYGVTDLVDAVARYGAWREVQAR
jgi:integrating conjugative element protein (TIGR03757 family)